MSTGEIGGGLTRTLSNVTGPQPSASTRSVVVSFGSYDVIVEVTNDGRFAGIRQIAIKKDFRTAQQRLASSDYHDVEEFYKE